MDNKVERDINKLIRNNKYYLPTKKYKLEIKTVVKPINEEDTFEVTDKAFIGSGTLINSKFLDLAREFLESLL